LIRRRGDNGILVLTAAFFAAFTLIAMNYFVIAYRQEHVSAAAERSELTICAGESQGTIYDRYMRPLVNRETCLRAVAVPTALNREKTVAYAADRESFLEAYDKGVPFVFECRKDTPDLEGLTVFGIPERYGGESLAQHIVGYTSDGRGVAGIEAAYDAVLRNGSGENSVTYSIDGFGRVLIGDGKKVTRSSASKTGVVTTLDSDIQRICEKYGSAAGRGAVAVVDVKNGDILGMASFPGYTTDGLGAAVNDKDSPLIDRCLYSYGVGSIFKLVTACEAIQENKGGYRYCCTGSTSVGGQNFNCHLLDGHGLQGMSSAMTNSCNTYFISLSKELNVEKLRKCAYNLGFGRETYLCEGIVGSAGVLPTVRELEVPAELANFSFGQGKLTATPLQITQLTCAIANEGEMPVLRLIKGMTLDGKSTANEKSPQFSAAIDRRTASLLRQMMISAIRDNSESKARSEKVQIGAKTSTAQTGRYGSDGEELCHAWITGFFPAESPGYALTVLVEDGGYGNTAAAPIFRSIAEEITALKK